MGNHHDGHTQFTVHTLKERKRLHEWFPGPVRWWTSSASNGQLKFAAREQYHAPLTTQLVPGNVSCTVGKTTDSENHQGAFAAVLLRPAGNLQRELDVPGTVWEFIRLFAGRSYRYWCVLHAVRSRLPEISETANGRCPWWWFRAVNGADQGGLAAPEWPNSYRNFTAVKW